MLSFHYTPPYFADDSDKAYALQIDDTGRFIIEWKPTGSPFELKNVEHRTISGTLSAERFDELKRLCRVALSSPSDNNILFDGAMYELKIQLGEQISKHEGFVPVSESESPLDQLILRLIKLTGKETI